MTLDEVAAGVRTVVEEYLGTGTLNMESSVSDLGMDSLDTVEMILDLEDHFSGLDLGTYEPHGNTTLAEVAVEVHKLLGELA